MDFTSEATIEAELLAIAKIHDSSARVLTVARTVPENTLTVLSKIVIIVSIGNFELVKALMKAALPTRGNLTFESSEAILQSGSLDVDYLYMTAKILPKFN